MERVKRLYPDLPFTKQIEEAVAEMYRNRADGRDRKGLVQRALVMDRSASGGIGRRGDEAQVLYLEVDNKMRNANHLRAARHKLRCPCVSKPFCTKCAGCKKIGQLLHGSL